MNTRAAMNSMIERNITVAIKVVKLNQNFIKQLLTSSLKIH
jgi:hypothetical protein